MWLPRWNFVKMFNADFQKEWWCPELDKLKQACIDITNLWSSYIGRPRSGCINAERLRCKYRYKQAIKMAALEYDRSFNDIFTNTYVKKMITASGKHGVNEMYKSQSKR